VGEPAVIRESRGAEPQEGAAFGALCSKRAEYPFVFFNVFKSFQDF
jgi:hypothetical protein